MLMPGIVNGGDFLRFEKLLTTEFSTVKHFKAGETVFGEAERSKHISYYVMRGRVNSELLHERGGSVELSVRSEGSIIPLFYTFETTAMEMVIEFTALTDCDLLLLSRKRLVELLRSNPDMAIAMMDAYARWGTYLDYSLTSLLFDPIQTRVADFLYLQINARGEVPSTQEQIAKAVSASRPNVARALSCFRKEGIVETKRGRVAILNKNALLKHCSYTVRSSKNQTTI